MESIKYIKHHCMLFCSLNNLGGIKKVPRKAAVETYANSQLRAEVEASVTSEAREQRKKQAEEPLYIARM